MTEPSPAPALHVSGLRKTFGDFTAVDDVDLEIAPRGSLAVVGESGSGKTTTARMIAGLEKPTAGTVLLGGRGHPGRRARTAERMRFAREVQMVFQDPYSSLDRRQRVGDGLAEVLTLHTDLREAALAERVTELLDHVGLDERQAAALPRALSGGQRQRVAIARALAVRPRLLVLDEAVAALDVSVQAQILGLLADIRRRTEVAYLFITHDLGIVRHICDDVAVMYRGRVVERGPAATVLTAPEDPYTRRLLDSVPRRGWKPTRHTPRNGTPT
ncbi:ATP-binding cassette domain-containing protein [Streptomyces phaeoluteigriseus]|uniref:ATP-binding cassette domain-containing protein n=1 Tax=Streptomyces phaeoluteigriseus TaxID=114686 RepID=A0ABY4ZBQ3_9ACTN|nr:ATP-binding cassette domain-containing protein [Streptomyces phaeoluteigriseus]USQ86401.1 ATP-binding cassette domain-containing protein [Streptomyces phaeoluteigriseus]